MSQAPVSPLVPSSRAERIHPSQTLALTALAKKMKADGRPVIAFTAGEPDLPVPDSVREAAVAAIAADQGRYTPAAGLPELRESLAAWFTDRGFPAEPAEVMANSGAKSSIYLALYALLEEGDEVIIPKPYWSSYPDMTVAAEGRPVFVEGPAERGFYPSLDALEAAITPKTRVLMLNSPNNPTGALLDSDEFLNGVAKLVRAHPRLAVVSDEIYSTLLYEGHHFRNLLSVAPDLKGRVLQIDGLSKSHSMTGWRMGFTKGPAEVIAAMARLQGQVAGNPNAIAQRAAIRALAEPASAERMERLDERRLHLIKALREVAKLEVPTPLGAFYAFPKISAWYGKRYEGEVLADSDALCAKLLQVEEVAVIPGSAFGAPEHMRLTYCIPREEIDEGVARIARFLGALT